MVSLCMPVHPMQANPNPNPQLNLTRGLQGAISFATEMYYEIICSLQGCTSNPPARTEKWQRVLYGLLISSTFSYPTSSEPVAFFLKNWFCKHADIFAEWTSFPKNITNSANSPPQKSSDQDSSYLMDAQSVFAEFNDSSEDINPEIHLVALKNLNRLELRPEFMSCFSAKPMDTLCCLHCP